MIFVGTDCILLKNSILKIRQIMFAFRKLASCDKGSVAMVLLVCHWHRCSTATSKNILMF